MLGRVGAWFGILSCVVAVACVHPAEERVERDLAVGHAEAEGAHVDVRAGLAVVRNVSRSSLELWSNAPNLEIDLELVGTQNLEVRVSNCMPGATLQLAAGRGRVATVDTGSTHRTNCAWAISPDSATLALRLRAPEPSATGFQFAVLSDIQRAIDEVQDIFMRINAEPDLAFVLSAGDLTSQGTGGELQRFQQELEGLDLPYYTTLGNHELGQSPPLYHDYFGRGSAHFEYRGVHFTTLDSASATIDPTVYRWLDRWLEVGRDSVHVVATHIPPIDPVGVRNGSFASRAEAAKLLGRLAEGGVDLTLYGHIHSYYRFQNAGIPAHISGGGGAIPEAFDGVGRHFLVVTVDRSRGIQGTRIVQID